MARKTIADLEKTINQLQSINKGQFDQLQECYRKIDDLENNKNIVPQETFNILKKELEHQKTMTQQYEKIVRDNKVRYDELFLLKDKLVTEVEELKETGKKGHNERNAGRNRKFSPLDIENIKKDRESGKTIKQLSGAYNCSIGLIHKLINE